MTVPANATLLSASGFDRAAIMRRAAQLARQFREDEARCYRNRWSAELRYGGKVPPMVASSWREAMSEALRIVWRKAREERAMTPAVAAEIEAVEIGILSIKCAERPSRVELTHLSTLQARAVELRSHLHA